MFFSTKNSENKYFFVKTGVGNFRFNISVMITYFDFQIIDVYFETHFPETDQVFDIANNHVILALSSRNLTTTIWIEGLCPTDHDYLKDKNDAVYLQSSNNLRLKIRQ